MPIEIRSAERMLHASRIPAETGSTISAAISRMPDDPHRERDGDGGERGNRNVERGDGNAGHAGSFLVEHDGAQRPVEEREHGEARNAEDRDDDHVLARDSQDRAEEILKEVDVERAGERDEHDAARDPGVEDERQRLVTGRMPLSPQPLDRHAADHRGDQRGKDR